MKKLIMIIAAMSACYSAVNALNQEEYKDKFSMSLLYDHVRAVKLINKIESNTSKNKEKILKTMLEFELDMLEDTTNMYLELLASEQSEYQGTGNYYVEEIQNKKEALKVIAEWRNTYL